MPNLGKNLVNWLVSKTGRSFTVPGKQDIAPLLPTIQGRSLIQSASPVTPQQQPAPQIQIPQQQPTSQQQVFKQQPASQIKKETSVPKTKEEQRNLIKKLIQVESGGSARATSTKGARGLTQMREEAWHDVNQYVRKPQGLKIYDYSKSVYNEAINRIYGQQYLFERIPQLLRQAQAPVTLENVLAAYNWGIGNLSNAGFDWTKAPYETLTYIQKIR